jgi:hypothetical protein
MKKRKTKQSSKAPVRSRRFAVIAICVTTVIVVGAAITVLSKQLANDKPPTPVSTKAASANAGKKYISVKVAGRDVQVDPQTGQIKPLTPAEAQQLADGLKTMLNKSTEGLVPEKHPDGSVSINLQGRFQNVAVARVNADGTLEQSCVDDPVSAAQFFGIDPKLLGVEAPKTIGPSSAAAGQPFRTPAKKVSQ